MVDNQKHQEEDLRTLDEITCPYCNHRFMDSWEYEDNLHNIKCESCKRKFDFKRVITTEYYMYKKID